jgi:hypothetical protein
VGEARAKALRKRRTIERGSIFAVVVLGFWCWKGVVV